MGKSLNNDLVRIRYALESVDSVDRESIVRLVETAACMYSEREAEAAELHSLACRGVDNRLIIRREN